MRASSLFKSQPKEVSESSPEGLEDPEDADLSVTALGPIGGPKPKPEPSKGGACDETIEAEIAELYDMTTGELAAKYKELYGQPTRTSHRQYLIRKNAWRIQADAFGGLSEGT